MLGSFYCSLVNILNPKHFALDFPIIMNGGVSMAQCTAPELG